MYVGRRPRSQLGISSLIIGFGQRPDRRHQDRDREALPEPVGQPDQLEPARAGGRVHRRRRDRRGVDRPGHGVRRQDWARITGTVLFALSTVDTIVGLTAPLAAPVKIWAVAVWLVALTAIVFLWRRNSTAYFKGTPHDRRRHDRGDRLTKRFGPVTAVDDLSFTVRPGHVTGFLGPNGAGKTTTMRVILGLAAPTSGRALVGGRRYDALIRPLREVGSLLDATALHGGRTAWMHLVSVARSNGIGRPPGHRGAPADRAGGGRGPPGQRLLARHEAAARHRRRAARRPPGADVRRAGQRPGPGGHPLDPRVLQGAGRPGPHRPGLQPPDERDGA